MTKSNNNLGTHLNNNNSNNGDQFVADLFQTDWLDIDNDLQNNIWYPGDKIDPEYCDTPSTFNRVYHSCPYSLPIVDISNASIQTLYETPSFDIDGID